MTVCFEEQSTPTIKTYIYTLSAFKDVGSSFLKLLMGAEMKTMLNNAIKIIGPCARFFARLVQRYEI